MILHGYLTVVIDRLTYLRKKHQEEIVEERLEHRRVIACCSVEYHIQTLLKNIMEKNHFVKILNIYE